MAQDQVRVDRNDRSMSHRQRTKGMALPESDGASAASAVSGQTAASRVAFRIRRLIRNGDLVPGQWIRQDDLAAQLKISRIPVREALHRLHSQGLVEVHVHRGAMVAPITPEAMREIDQLRDLLESYALRLAAKNNRRVHVEAAEAALAHIDRTLESKDFENYYDDNDEFHFAIIRACQSARLMSMIESLWTSWVPYRGVYYREGDLSVFKSLQRDHKKILKAFKDGDGEALSTLQRNHRRGAVDAISELAWGRSQQ